MELLNIAPLKYFLTFSYRQVHVCGKDAEQKSEDGMN